MIIEYPEHEKLTKFVSDTEIIEEFLEVMQQKGIILAQYGTEELYPINDDNRIIAEYFGIDLKKLEAEKKEIIKSIIER